jgi:hypothetical protein
MDTKFPLNAVCLCNKVFVTGLVLRDMIIGSVYVYTQHHIPESPILLVK